MSSKAGPTPDGLVREHWQLETVCFAGVRRKYPGPSRVCKHRYSAAGRHGLMRQQVRHIEELLERVRSDDARLAKQRADHRVGGSECPGVRRSCACSGLRAACFDHYDGFSAAYAFRDAAKLSRITEALEIKKDH